MRATGLIALLGDVAMMAKLAAASSSDVAAQIAKAGVKAAGVVINETAVASAWRC
jgi:predicted DNA repair protein MutK